MCGAEPQAEHPRERSERHDGLVMCFRCIQNKNFPAIFAPTIPNKTLNTRVITKVRFDGQSEPSCIGVSANKNNTGIYDAIATIIPITQRLISLIFIFIGSTHNAQLCCEGATAPKSAGVACYKFYSILFPHL